MDVASLPIPALDKTAQITANNEDDNRSRAS